MTYTVSSGTLNSTILYLSPNKTVSVKALKGNQDSDVVADYNILLLLLVLLLSYILEQWTG